MRRNGMINQAHIHHKTNVSLARSAFHLVAFGLTVLFMLSGTAMASVRQTASARTPDSHCTRNPDGSASCDATATSLTISFSATLAGSKLILLAQWFTLTQNGTTTGSMGGCTDSLGQ